MLKAYIEYIKDNPEKLWFKRKLYGWGWTPVTWQGWLVLVVFVGGIVGNAYRIDSLSYSEYETSVKFLSQTAAAVVLLIIICWKKGERPRWQWGSSRK